MTKMRLFLYFFLSTCIQNLYGQIDYKFCYNIDSPTPLYAFNNDSTDHNFKILQLPILGLDFQGYSNPSLNDFVSNTNNVYTLNLNNYNNSIQNVSHHHLDVRNVLLYYSEKKGQSISSFGVTHRIFGELSLSNDLIDLIINGNYPYVNETIYLDNNYLRLYNYFSLFYGRANRLGNKSLFAFKFKLLKGFSSFGFDNREFNILVSDHYGTENNPFSSIFNTDLMFSSNSDYSILSNIGLAVDFEFHHQLSDQINMYTQLSELGFISWREDQYTSQGSFDFDGINYSLDEDLMTEFNNMYDTIVDIFDIRENNNIKSIDLLPLEGDFGLNFCFKSSSEIFINYNFKKLFNTFLSTGSITYLHNFDIADLSLMSHYSFNKFNYTNFSFYLGKRWNYILHTNIYIKNILGFFNSSYEGFSQDGGLGCEVLLSF